MSAIMVQGTASSVGKSVLVTALCRLFRQDGFRVAPFKAQNMSNNAAVTADGGEIGRAQAVQAAAAGIDPTVDMNPILLKPESDRRCQVIVHGRAVGQLDAHSYPGPYEAAIAESYTRLRAAYDVLVIEGAGSPAEINLRDLVNMKVARMADAPVLLVGDIDRGGVFASIVGTLELLEPADRARVAGLVINKFRGDPSLLQPGLDWLHKRTGIPVLGVLPWLPDLGIADEDAVALDERPARGGGSFDIAVIRYPHISNFDDLDPLAAEPGVRVRFVTDAAAAGSADLVVLPGSKSTVADLCWLRERGFPAVLRDRRILGICGGCQMLGQRIDDPDGVEAGSADGLGLLPLRTRFRPLKTTARVRARAIASTFLAQPGDEVEGYEIHAGQIETDSPIFSIDGRPDGAAAGLVVGTLIHGLFANASVRRALLGRATDSRDPYDALARVAREHLDWAAIKRITARSPSR